jgi:hypothetical protein
MTLVEMFRCRACHYQQGPFGTHGFNPTTKSGELIGKCPRCQMLAVVRVVGGTFQSACHVCRTPYEGYDGSCPKCGSRDCGFA